MTPPRTLAGLFCLLLAVGTAGCGRSDPDAVTVFAAASLAEVMEDLASSFESSHEGVAVTLSVAGSQRLAAQIRDGAPADVFVSANREQIEAVAGEITGEPVVVATNELVIAVEPGNPLGIAGLNDLTGRLRLVLAAPEVPAGDYARRALDSAGVTVTPADHAPSVRAALSKVGLGEADAAIVYASDVIARDQEVEAVPIDSGVRAEYLAAIIADSSRLDVSRAFVRHLRSDAGAAILSDHGFGPP